MVSKRYVLLSQNSSLHKLDNSGYVTFSIFFVIRNILLIHTPVRPTTFPQGHLIFNIESEETRILLSQNWKTTNVPTVADWRKKLLEYSELARFIGRIRNQRDQQFQLDWSKFLEYLKDGKNV